MVTLIILYVDHLLTKNRWNGGRSSQPWMLMSTVRKHGHLLFWFRLVNGQTLSCDVNAGSCFWMFYLPCFRKPSFTRSEEETSPLAHAVITDMPSFAEAKISSCICAELGCVRLLSHVVQIWSLLNFLEESAHVEIVPCLFLKYSKRVISCTLVSVCWKQKLDMVSSTDAWLPSWSCL